jgi:hypothetical protein
MNTILHCLKVFVSGILFYVIVPLVLLLAQLWSFGAIYFCSFSAHPEWRSSAAWGYAALMVIGLLASRKYSRALVIAFLSFLGIAVWFSSIQPPANGVYPANLVMPGVEFQGDRVTIHNVRNCDYRTRDDYDVHYETRTYSLKDLKTLDVMVNYWGMDWIAHTFLSFGFSDGRYLSVSVEIRPEVGESYGEVKGIFKQYELIYIWADERDLVRTRTNYRNENVYLYRTSFTPDQVRKFFVNMLERTERIRQKPEFYNTITQSCTNTLGDHLIDSKIMSLPFWKRRLLTGKIDRRLYDQGLLETFGRPFPELRAISKIDERAKAADQDIQFSEKIRTHLSVA